MTHAYNCTKHASTTYSPYYLMFGRHPRLPNDVEFGLHNPNCSDKCSKSRYIQKLRRRLNYAHKKASKYSSEQAQKYKTSYDKSVKGPQLQVNDLVLVKIVAHKQGVKFRRNGNLRNILCLNNLFLVLQYTELDQLLVPKLELYTGIFYCHLESNINLILIQMSLIQMILFI